MRAYVSENYRAAVILLDDGGYTYLDKFAVLDDAQGEGLGRAVWQVMRDAHPRVFWRSRHHNVINIFYYAESDGCYKEPEWKLFWYGMRDLADVERCIGLCRARPATLADPS
jgi:acetylglutamate kinase